MGNHLRNRLFFFFFFFCFLTLGKGCKKEVALPIVETSEIYANSLTSIYVSGLITNDGGSTISEKGFVGCTIPGISLQKHTFLTEEGEGSGYFERIVSGLTPGIWYFKAYAINEAGVAYSEEKAIDTIEESLPKVETTEVIAPTTTRIYVKGHVTSNPGTEITEKGFIGCTIPAPSHQRHTYLTEEGLGNGYFERIISNVSPGTWYFRAYAVNEAGLSYGEEITLNTIEESLYYKYIMEQEDYAHLVSIDPIPHAVFEDFGYYYGASSFFNNFDFRLQGRRLDKDEEGNYIDPELGLIYENQGADAAIDEMFNRLLHDGLIEVLRLLHPNAKPKQGEYEVEYEIEFETFHDNWVRRFPVAKYRCTASGSPPDFELVSWIIVH